MTAKKLIMIVFETKTQEKLSKYSAFSIIDYLGSRKLIGKNIAKMKGVIRPSDGRKIRFSECHITVGQILLKLAMLELEALRLSENKNDNNKFLLYLSTTSDAIPVTTNRHQIASLMGTVCPETVGNKIHDLQIAEYVIKKTNTNCQGLDEIGGRGNFRLLLNKDWIYFASGFMEEGDHRSDINNQNVNTETGERHTDSPGNPAIENQSINSPKKETLQPSSSVFYRTNNTNNKELKGVDSPHQQKKPAEAGKYKTEQRKQAKLDGKVAPGEEKFLDENRFVSKNFGDITFSRDDNDFFAVTLIHQMAKLYEKPINDQETVKKLLILHLNRVQFERGFKRKMEAYLYLSRAINLVVKWINRENANRTKAGQDKFILFPPTSWLRIDWQRGTLKNVIDEWMPKNDKFRIINNARSQKIIDWQEAIFLQEKLTVKCLESLRQGGFSSCLFDMRRGYKNLKDKLVCTTLSQEKQQEILNGFLNKMNISQWERIS